MVGSYQELVDAALTGVNNFDVSHIKIIKASQGSIYKFLIATHHR
jgi:hypothetical protein